jgi:3-methyladenine DNA glycosylase AlkD
MTFSEHTAAFEKCLRPLSNAERAQPMQAYLLNQFAFLGLPAPIRRAAVKALLVRPVASAEALFGTAEQLWRLPEREFRYTAIDLLRRHARLLNCAHLPALRDLLVRDAWWDTVDGLGAVVNLVVRADRGCGAQTAMDGWLLDDNMWVRRTAMLHQLGWRLDTDRTRLEAYALQLAGEEEFFIRKAIGWALRDYARWNPDFVRQFVAQRSALLSPLTQREARRHLAAAAPGPAPR